MNIQRINRTEHVLYDSLEELEAYALPACKKHNPHAYHASTTAERRGWYGGPTDGNEARLKILNGWPELLERLRPMVAQLDANEHVTPHRATVRRRKTVRGDHGDFIDMHRVYAGQLDTAWTRPKRQNLVGMTDRKATLVVNVSLSAHTNFDETLWRAATALKISDMLTGSGRSVEIFVGCAGSDVGQAVYESRIYTRVKAYTQPITIERLAAMCSAAYMRTYMFMALGAIDDRIASNLGYPSDGICCQLQARKDAGELVVELARCFTFADALRDIESVQKQLLGTRE